MFIDFKDTIWGRIEIPEEHKEKVLDLLKSGEVTSSDQLLDNYPELGLHYVYLSGTSTQIVPEDNDGASTLIAVNNQGNTDWQNGKGD